MTVINMGFSEFIEDNVKTLVTKMEWVKDRNLKCVESLEELRNFIDKAIEVGRCAVDLETTGLNSRMKKIIENNESLLVPIEKIVGIGLCYDPKFSIYIPINHKEDVELNLPEKEVLEEINRLCKNCITIYHNAKFDLSFLENHGIKIDNHKKIEDTLILARLYDAGQKEINLKILSERLLGQHMLSFEDIVRNTKRFDMVSPKIGYVYGASDPMCTLDLFTFFINQEIIKKQQIIYDLEKRVIFVVMEMERYLIKIDVPYLKELKTKIITRIKEIKDEIYALVGREFNIGSPQQLGKILFEELNYTYPEKNRSASGQYITNNAALEKIVNLYPVVKKIMEFRELEKSLNTYVDNLLLNYDENDCVKLGFNQSGTDTGRFSSPGGSGLKEDGYSAVNIQSTPKRPPKENPWLDMRRAFICRPGKTLVAADYENEEMRVATNLSKETKWMEDIRNKVDFHTSTAAIITGKNIKDISPAERDIAKTVNFLALYLGGPYTLAAQAHISVPEAKRILKTFFAGVPRLKKWIDSEILKARKIKIVKTAFGRIRPLNKFYDSGDKSFESHGDRCAINTQIQGASADIMKVVMARLYSWIHRNNLQEDIKILITMHDELVFEITTEKIEILIPEIAKIMMLPEVIRDQLKWDVPLTVDIKLGESWRVKEKFFEKYPDIKEKLYGPLIEISSVNYANGASNKEIISAERAPNEILDTKEVINQNTVSQNMSTPVNSAINDQFLVYTIKDRRKVTLRWLNDILTFLISEKENDVYNSQKKILKLKDSEGNSLLVSEYKISVDSFLSLARFFGI